MSAATVRKLPDGIWNRVVLFDKKSSGDSMIESEADFPPYNGAGDSSHVGQQLFKQQQPFIQRNSTTFHASAIVNEQGDTYSIENDETDIPLRILIPNEFIGAIIGRGGSTIRAISKGTGARVDIIRHFNRNYDMPEKPISISGKPDKVTQAAKKIMELTAQEANHQRNRDGQMDIALKIFIPNSVVGRIIGKNGTVIKELMKDTQTKIHISSQPDFIEHGMRSNQRIVTIRGSIDGMSQAESLISEKLREAFLDGKVRDRDLDFGTFGNNGHEASDLPIMGTYFQPNQNGMQQQQYSTQFRQSRFPPVESSSSSRGTFPLSLNSSSDGISLSRPETSYMYVPDESVGALIGRNGSSIRGIIRSSGASIKVLEGVIILNDYPFRRVVIHGGVDSLFLAEYLIYQRVFEGGNGRAQVDDAQLTVEMTVPTELVGRLIGKGGLNIRDIQRQNFCRVKFLTEPDLSIPPPADGETYVRITGTAHAFLSAQKRIRALLVKAMNKAFSMSNNDSRNTESPEEERPTHTHDAPRH